MAISLFPTELEPDKEDRKSLKSVGLYPGLSYVGWEQVGWRHAANHEDQYY